MWRLVTSAPFENLILFLIIMNTVSLMMKFHQVAIDPVFLDDDNGQDDHNDYDDHDDRNYKDDRNNWQNISTMTKSHHGGNSSAMIIE